jgi:hypothetical protein
VDDERRPSYEELADLVVSQAQTIDELRSEKLELHAPIERLESCLAELERFAREVRASRRDCPRELVCLVSGKVDPDSRIQHPER